MQSRFPHGGRGCDRGKGGQPGAGDREDINCWSFKEHFLWVCKRCSRSHRSKSSPSTHSPILLESSVGKIREGIPEKKHPFFWALLKFGKILKSKERGGCVTLDEVVWSSHARVTSVVKSQQEHKNTDWRLMENSIFNFHFVVRNPSLFFCSYGHGVNQKGKLGSEKSATQCLDLGGGGLRAIALWAMSLSTNRDHLSKRSFPSTWKADGV